MLLMMQNKLYLGDCLDIMPKLPSDSFDMILCDLPYGVTALHWDKKINLSKLARQYERLLKPNGVMALTSRQPFTTDLMIAFGGWFKYELIWCKTFGGGFLEANKKPLSRHENILIFSPTSINYYTYNPQKSKGKPYYSKGGGNHKQSSVLSRKLKPIPTINDGNYFPTSLINVEHSQYKSLHPTQKPVELFTYLIKTYTDRGDLILDNCIGSGTTAIAAMETDRYVVGIEKDPEIYEICKNRIFEYKAHQEDIMKEENINRRVEEFLSQL